MSFICLRNLQKIVMYKLLIILALFIAPSLAFGQNQTITTEKNIEISTLKIEKLEVAIKKIDPISANPKVQSVNFTYKKSKDIISIKAYIKSLDLRCKETVLV